MEHDGLAAEIVAVVLRESNVKIALLTGGNADELALKAGNEGVGAENEILVLRRAAVERDAVEHAGVVDVHGVAVLRGTLHGDEAGVLLAQALDVAVNLFVGDFNGGLLRLKALILAEGDLGVNVGAEAQKRAVLLGDLGIGHGRTADGLKLALSDAERKSVVRGVIKGVIIEHVLAVHALNDHAGRLALAEAGDHDAAASLQICTVDILFKLGGVELDIKGNGVFFFLAVLDNHVGVTPLYISAGTEYANFKPIHYSKSKCKLQRII